MKTMKLANLVLHQVNLNGFENFSTFAGATKERLYLYCKAALSPVFLGVSRREQRLYHTKPYWSDDSGHVKHDVHKRHIT